MATSSITKDFVVKDRRDFDKMKRYLEQPHQSRDRQEAAQGLREGERLLVSFVFR